MINSDALAKAIEEMERAHEQNKLTDLVYGVKNGAPPLAAWPKELCKILFLDFDGVLNSESSARQNGNRYKFSKDSVAALNHILRQTRAYIVITSSWRESWSLIENAASLEQAGVISGRVVGKTAILDQQRGLEIDAWLMGAPYRVQAFAILDDRDDMLMHQHRLIRTNPEIGLTMELAEKAIALLT